MYANVLLGNLATAQADLSDLAAVVAKLPPRTVWSLAGIGTAQLPIAAVAAAMAPGVRIGLEDNLWADRERTQTATNVGLVERVHRLAPPLGREVMSPTQCRALLGLPPRG